MAAYVRLMVQWRRFEELGAVVGQCSTCWQTALKGVAALKRDERIEA
jgi:hypothetical protein